MPDSLLLQQAKALRKKLERIMRSASFAKSSKELHDLYTEEVRWLLRFYRVDLTGETEWTTLGTKILGFAVRLMGAGSVWPASVLDGRAELGLAPGYGGVPTQLPAIPTEQETREIHARVREVLDALRPIGGATQPVNVSLPAQIQLVQLSSIDGQTIKRRYGSEWPDWFWLALAAALEEFGERISRCEASDCARLFLRVRRQAYCSAECSQRVRSRRWYQAHATEARAQRRNTYDVQVRRKLYPKAKVHRKAGQK
jgi:hypothetical protein